MATSSGSKNSFHLLLFCTGSVACIKVPPLITALKNRLEDCDIQVVVTENSMHFLDMDQLEVKVLRDRDEWSSWTKIGDPVLHIELRKWADALLIAPLDANTLAKIATGLCDNLVTSVVRAWEVPATKPLLFAPAMNTAMWNHPVTAQHIDTLKAWGFAEIPPVAKKLACGDEGVGAMSEVCTIVDAVSKVVMLEKNW